jgi:hypothetical protein
MMLIRVSVSRWRCRSIELPRRWRQSISVWRRRVATVMVRRRWCRRRRTNYRRRSQGRQVRHRRCIMNRGRRRRRPSVYMSRRRALLACRSTPIAVCRPMSWWSCIGVGSWWPSSKGMVGDKRRCLHCWGSCLRMAMRRPGISRSMCFTMSNHPWRASQRGRRSG